MAEGSCSPPGPFWSAVMTWRSTLRIRPSPIRSSTSVSAQYHCQENQRRSSTSGATTAARTPAASRSLSARPGLGLSRRFPERPGPSASARSNAGVCRRR